MYDNLINQKIKCVWQDGNSSKAVYGIVKATDNLFLTLVDEKNATHYISLKNIISIKEVD